MQTDLDMQANLLPRTSQRTLHAARNQLHLPANLSSLELEEPSALNCRAHDALRATSWGRSLVPCSRTKKATHSPAASILPSHRLRDGDIATGDVHVFPCKDGTCARVAASLNRCFWLCPYPKPLPKPYKPETLNPETESGTSGAGPGPAPPLESSRYTRVRDRINSGELCGQTPPQIKSDSCANGDLTSI